MSGLRVIGGTSRGRRLFSVPGETTRPITDQAKESLFNIIGADIQGATFLDLFAGTGSVGIEALSRGADFCLFVDVNWQPVETIRRNLDLTGFKLQSEVLKTDSLVLLERPPRHSFDYVYIAPPQYKGLWKEALLKIDSHQGWLSEDAWVITQIHPVEYEALEHEAGLKNLLEFDQRDYGSTRFVFYERRLA